MSFKFFKNTLVTLAVLAISSSASPLQQNERSSQKSSETLEQRAIVGSGFQLRIMPLGDSITYGYLSSDNNGYRLQLQTDLSGSNLQYVGSVRQGNMADNYNEGHPGHTINQIITDAQLSINTRPNVILIHAGTNDMNQSPPTDPYASAPARLGKLIDSVLHTCPDATVLVAQIINAESADTESRILTFNSQIPGVVAQRALAGYKVMTVDMSSITTQYLSDGLHPSDEGYKMMGDLWFAALQKADSRGWLRPPASAADTASSPSGDVCDVEPLWIPANSGNQIATGIGKDGAGVRFADMDGDGRDDYIYLNTDGSVIVYLNGGASASGNWIWYPQNGGQPIATGIGAPREQIRFADINGDGKADYLAVDDTTGAVTAYFNGGASTTAPNGWLWIAQGQIASGIGDGAGVQFADIDGDGRADYIWLSPTGAATVYRNQVGLISQNWEALNNGQPVATGVGATRAEVQFADINGDGRADYLWVAAADGSVQAWINQVGINPANWVPDSGKIATGVGTTGSNIEFARLVSHRADYIEVNAGNGAINAWINNCPGGTSGGDSSGSSSTPILAAINAMGQFYSTSSLQWTDVGGWIGANAYNDIMDYDHYFGGTTFESLYGQSLYDIATSASLQNSVGATDVYNDDQLWWCLAMLRAYQNYGHVELLNQVINQWKQIGASSLLVAGDAGSTPNKGGVARSVAIPAGCDVDGAVYWNQQADSGVTAISTGLYAQVGAWLYGFTHDTTYRTAADRSLNWLERVVVDPNTGILTTDNINLPTCGKNPGALTYNTGVYLGALTSLYRSTSDGQYLTRADLTATSSTTGFFGNSPPLVVNQQDDITTNGDGVAWRDILFRNLLDYYNLLNIENVNPEVQGKIKAFFQANYNQIKANAQFGNLYAANWFGKITSGSDWGTESVLSVLLGALLIL